MVFTVKRETYKEKYEYLDSNEKKLKKIINSKITWMLVLEKDIRRHIYDEEKKGNMPYSKKCELLGQRYQCMMTIDLLQDILLDMKKLRMWGETQ